MPAGDVYEHYRLIKEAESSHRMWALTTHDFPHLQRANRREIWQRAIDIAPRSERTSTWEIADDEMKVVIIGCKLKNHGDRWIAKHTTEMTWLASQRISVQSAIRAFEQWDETIMSHPFWTPANKSK